METDRLRYFCAIVDSGSMTKAADVLGLSHSGLSKSVAVLQDEVGYKVFRPQGRGLELTEEGRALYNHAQEILALVRQMGSKSDSKRRVVRIGLPEVLALSISGAIAKSLGSEVTIDEMDTGEIEAKILERKIDFGLTFVPFPHKEIDHLKLAKISFASFAKRGAFERHSLEIIPYVIPSIEMKDNPLSIKIRDGWDSRLPRATPFGSNSLGVALTMVRNGACAVFVPKMLIKELNRTAQPEHQLVEIEPAQRSAERTIFLVKRNNECETPEMKKVTKIIRTHASAGAP